MLPKTYNNEFTPQHHAILFAIIARSVMNQIGEKRGGKLIRKAVKEYGQQRGKRMALRAKNNNHSLSIANYFAYGEWAAQKEEMNFKFTEKMPHARMNIFKCPWYDTWEQNDLLEYGKYYCMEIDAALVKGFNPGIEIQINSTKTNGGQFCDFVFRNANLSFLKLLNLAYKKKIRPGKEPIMPWEYHLGHLFKSMGETIHKTLGGEPEKIMSDALNDFAVFFSGEAVDAIKRYQSTDFNKLPQ